jgi:hypothetical protein
METWELNICFLIKYFFKCSTLKISSNNYSKN